MDSTGGFCYSGELRVKTVSLVCEATLRAINKRCGVSYRRHTYVSAETAKQMEGLFGKVNDTRIALQFGLRQPAVSGRRNRLGIAPYSHSQSVFLKIRDCLGTMPDRQVAKLSGLSAQIVYSQRRKHGIPVFPNKPAQVLSGEAAKDYNSAKRRE